MVTPKCPGGKDLVWTACAWLTQGPLSPLQQQRERERVSGLGPLLVSLGEGRLCEVLPSAVLSSCSSAVGCVLGWPLHYATL